MWEGGYTGAQTDSFLWSEPLVYMVQSQSV